MRSDRELDELIDAALPEYSEAEPQPGLEQRTLAHALAEGTRRKPRAWGWVLAIPSIACLLVFLFLTTRHNPSHSALDVTAKNTPATTAATPGGMVSQAASSQQRREARPGRLATQLPTQRAPLPKQDVFPSPASLTAEEQAMMAFANAQAIVPPPTAQAEIEISETHIAELEIKPLPVLADQKLGPSATPSALTSQQP